MNRLVNFLKDVRIELGKVSWPTKNQTFKYSMVVIAFSVAVSLFLSACDLIFQFGLNKLILK